MVALSTAAQEPTLQKKSIAPEKIDLNVPDEQEPILQENPENKGQSPEEKTAKIIERIKKNMDVSQQRLEKDDPGPATRQIQRDIVQDLDELIEQEKNQNNQSSSSRSSSISYSRRKRSQRQQQMNQDQKTASQEKAKTDQKKQAGNQKKDPTELAKKDAGKKAGAKDQGAKDKKGQLAKNSGQGGNSSKKEKNTIADLYRDIWGHLPATKRQEMDAYARERFMRNYEDLLRQYYRTIAEQGRRQEGD